MATQAGALEYIISVNSSAVGKGLASAEASVKGFGNKMSSWAIAKGQLLGRFIEKAGQTTMQFVKSSVQESMSFDKSMAQVAATLGKTTKEVQTLAKFAREMGSKTAFTAQEAAEGLNYMALAGYDAETSMKMLPTVLNLAAAGNMKLADASDMVTDAQSALGLSIAETETMVDQMAKTSSKTNTSVSQLGAAFLTIGGTAKKLKGGTQELSALLGVLANNGIKGAEGGTALRNVLNGLSNPVGKAAKGLKKLGVEAYDADGNMRSLPDVLVEMNNALSDKTMKERTEMFAKMFNVRDLKSIEALLSMTTKDWKKLMDEIGDSENAATKMAETQLDNLTGDVTIFKSALSESKLAIVEGLTPALRNFTKAGTRFIQRVTDAFKKNGFTGALREANNMFSTLITNLKNNDSPVLQKLGGALEFVKTVGGEVWGLITNFPEKIKEWKEADSPGLNLLASVFEKVKGLADGVVTAFNEGLPAAIEQFKTSDDPFMNLVGGGLQVAYDTFNFIIEKSGSVENAIKNIALAFAGIKIAPGVMNFFSKLLQIAANKKILSMFGGGAGGGTESGAAGAATTKGGGIFKWAKTGLANIGAKAGALWTTAGGAWALSPLAALGLGLAPAEIVMAQTRQKWGADYNRRMNAANLPDDNAQFISEAAVALGTNGQVDWDKAENLLNGLAKRQNKQKAELYNLLKDSTTAGENTWNLLNKFWEGAELDPTQVNELLQDITDAFANNAEKVSVPIDPNVDVGSAQSQLNGAGLTVPVSAVITGGLFGNFWNKRARGEWYVPQDNYPVLAHRGEMVLNPSRARRYRDGESDGVNANIPSVIAQSVKESMKQVNFLLNGDKVADLTTNKTKRNINAQSYSRVRAYGGA